MHLRLRNQTATPQRVNFLMEGRILSAETLSAKETKEITLKLPEGTKTRWTVELNVPDACKKTRKEKVLGWNEYSSLLVESARLLEE